MDALHTFLPIDRLHALASGGELPNRAQGAVLFADVPGFTPLTEGMARVFGPQRGAEELTSQLNRVYTALIEPVHRYHGAVIGFSGDSINCWFDGDDGRRAAAAGLAMQAAVAALEPFQAREGLTFQPAIKVAIAVGPVRRFLAGDPAIQRLDVLTGSALEMLEQVGHLAERGMVLVEAGAAARLAASEAGLIFAGERAGAHSGARAAVLAGLSRPIPPNPWPEWKEPASSQQAKAGAPGVATGRQQEDAGVPHGAAGRNQKSVGKPRAAAGHNQKSVGEPHGAVGRIQQSVGVPRAAVGRNQKSVGEPLGAEGASLPADAWLNAWLLPAVQQRLRRGAQGFLAELRPVTVLFLNFGGLDYDDDEAEQLLDGYLRKVQECLVRYEGAPLQLNTGDKGSYLYAAFGAPLAHDDDAARALAAAQELLQISAETGFISGARVGIAQGGMYAGAYGSPTRQTYGLIGDKVNVAARLMQLAIPGEVLCDQEVYAQARRYWSFDTLPPVQLKGKAAPMPVYRPLRRRPILVKTLTDQAGGLAPLVGRQAEIDRLHALLERLQAGQSSLLFIEGEAGIGKSRMVAALLEMVKERGLAALLGSGQSIEQNVPYRAWRDVFLAFFELQESDSLPRRQAKVRRAATAALPRSLQRLPLLNDVLNLGLPETQLTAALDPKLRRESLFNLLVALLRARVQAGPLVLILEDAQWMDLLSWELAQNLVRVMLLEEQPLLLALVGRPLEETHAGAQVHAALRGLPACEVISLEALPEMALAELIAGQLGVSSTRLPAEVIRFVQARSDGNPFFAGELVQAMRDQGLISIEPGEDGPRCRAHPALDQAGQTLPGTLHGLILSRIDRLSTEQQLTIKVAAVIGRTFAYSPLRDTLIRFLPVADSTLKAHLSELVRRELTRLEISEPELTYIFKHIITQEAAYQSLLYAQRKEIHRIVARWYEALLEADASRAPGVLPLLAYHYRQAEHAERELFYARKAGEAAARAYANDSALAYLTRALELTPPEELESIYALRKLRLGIYALQGSLSAQQDEINRMAEIASQLDGSPAGMEKQAEVLLKRSRLYGNQGQYAEAEETARQAKALAYQTQNTTLQLSSHVEIGFFKTRRAQFSEAFQEMETALELARVSGLQEQEARLLHQLGVTANLHGNYAQSSTYFQQSLQTNRLIGHREGEGMALNNLGIASWREGNLTAAREYLEQSLSITREIGSRSGEVYPLANIGVILYQQRRYKDAILYCQQALALAREVNQVYAEAQAYGNLGSAYSSTGNFTLALSAYEQGLAITKTTGARQDEAVVLDNMAWVYIHMGDLDQAGSYLEKALQGCQEIGDRDTEACVERDQALRQLWLGSPEQALIHAGRALAIIQEMENISEKETYFIAMGKVQLQRNQVDQAAAAYQEAQKIFAEAGKPATEAAAGFIYIDLARQAISQAARRAEDILAFLENGSVADAVDPAAIYLACQDALQAAGDERCSQVLAKGYEFLQSVAGQLPEEQRQMYLENVPSNRALIQSWSSHAA